MKNISGSRSYSTYKDVGPNDTVGKTVEAVGWSTVDGPGGDEPCVTFFYSDGTQCGIVMPSDDETIADLYYISRYAHVLGEDLKAGKQLTIGWLNRMRDLAEKVQRQFDPELEKMGEEHE